MNKFWIITKREYLSRVTKKSFLLTTLLVPLIIVGFYGLMGVIIAQGFKGSEKEIAVVDETGHFNNKFRDGRSLHYVYSIPDLKQAQDSLDKNVYSGVLHIPPVDIYKVNDNIKLYSKKKLGPGIIDKIENQLERRVRQLRVEDQGLSDEVLDKLVVNLSVPEVKLGDSPEEADDTASKFLALIGFVSGLMLYFVLIFFGMMVMRGVKEEKTNRIVEVIISSVKPFQLMLGKIVGISFVGITQFAIWGVISFIGYQLIGLLLPSMGIDISQFQGDIRPEQIDSDLGGLTNVIYDLVNYDGYGKLFLAFFFYFIGGYLIYASLFSAVGSAVEDETQAQQLTFPIMIPIIISVYILITMFFDPNNSIATWASIFPLTSPVVMPARIPFNPPMWQIALSVGLLVASVFLFIWLSAKIYRTGILMYGKKITFKEMLKWLRY